MQCPNGDFTVQRDDAANTSLWCGLFHNNMASALTRLNEAKPFQCSDDFLSR